MSGAAMRGTPVSQVRTRPHSLTLGQANTEHVPFINQFVPQTTWNVPNTNDPTNAEANPQGAHDIDNPGHDDTFPGSTEEGSNPKPDERVTPPSPIITPQREDESLVPGTELPHSISVEQKTDSKNKTKTQSPPLPSLL